MIYRFLALVGFLFFSGCSSVPPPSKIPSSKLLSPPALICRDDNQSNPLEEPISAQEVENELPIEIKRVNDLEKFSQDIALYVDQNGKNQETLIESQKQFESNYYRPWEYTIPPICAKEAAWPINAFRSGYGSNLKLHDPLWFREMEAQSNFGAFGSSNLKAMTTKWMDLRVFPTIKPLYKNPSRPGDGYPFDLLQNSSVAFNEPIFVSHYSLDGGWAYVFTNNASGWVEANGIAIISEEQKQLFKSKEKLFILDDRVPLKDSNEHFMTYSRIGMVLPYSSETADKYNAFSVDSSGKMIEITIPKSSARVGITLLNKEDLKKIGTQLLRNTYGWGGMFEERDCSSMIRDYFTPFGIWLPRNSAQQAKKGEVIVFKDMNNTQKLSLIKEKGVPFETILYKKGHVLLYVGTYNDTVLAMHNIWGIRTKDPLGNKGRVIVGKAVISTLELGNEVENFDPSNMLLSTLVSMNIFTKAPTPLAQKGIDKKLSKF